MKQKTAMMQLFEKYGHLLPNIESEYIDLERTQIEDAYKYGYTGYDQDAEDYYTQTYNNETQKP